MASWENEDEDSGGSRQAAAMSTPADLQRQIQKNKDFIGNIHLKQDEKTGDSYVLGMRVPKNLRPVIELGIENAKPYIIDQSENIYKGASKLSGKLGFKTTHMQNKIGVIAENTFRWGIIGAQPIYGIVNASQTYAKERKQLFKDFAPIINASKTDYKQNEVIKSAFDRVHDDWLSNLKMVASDIPTLIPMAILGRQDQVATRAKRKEEEKKAINKNASAEERFKAREAEIAARETALNKHLEGREAEEKIFEKRKEEYIEKRIKEGAQKRDYSGKKAPMTEYELEREFEDKFADLYRKNSRDREDDGHESTKENNEKDKTDKMFKFLIPFASAISQIFKSNVEESADKRRKSIYAGKLITHMKEELDAQFSTNKDGEVQKRGVDDVSISLPESKNGGGRDLSLKEYIIEIFKQNELDNGRASLGNNLVAQLQPAVDMIAEHIADGSLDSSALLKLVGEHKVIIHQGSSRRFATMDQVEKSIAELLPTMSSKEDIKQEDFFANFADPALIKKIIKGNLDTLKGADRAFFASLFPDPILEQAGMKSKEIIEIRKEIHDRKYAIVAASIAYLSKKDPEELKKWGLTDKDIEAVNEMATKLEEKDAKAIEAAVDGRDKTIIAAIRTAGLNQQATKTGDADAYWTNRIKESEPVRTELAEAKKHQKEDRKAGDSERHRKLIKKAKPDEKFSGRIAGEDEIDEPNGTMSR